ncbi:unnamed protein product [Schistosoma curassoni]|nr:unnamed protein product [Schistosoma curassoni]
MDTSTNELINILKYDHLLIISTYTRTVLILVTVLIGVMLLVISCQLVIASVMALMIAFVKKIYEKYPLNVGLAIIYSICVASATGLWNLDVAITIQLVPFMTIFYSYFTVGKSRYRLFYPNYTLAALLLYIMFSTALPITDDLVYTIKNNWNVTNSTGFSLYNDTTL